MSNGTRKLFIVCAADVNFTSQTLQLWQNKNGSQQLIQLLDKERKLLLLPFELADIFITQAVSHDVFNVML